MNHNERPRLKTRLLSWVPWIALTVVCVLVYGRYLVGWMPVGGDNSLLYAPFYSLRWDGGPPLWNPYTLSGASLLDNLQAALLYPLRWPFFFVEDWRTYFGLFNFIHYLIAFIGAGLLMRALGVRRAAAIIGAIMYAAGGHLAGRIINPTIFYGCCWLPTLLLGAAGVGRLHAWATTLGAAAILWVGSPHLMFYGAMAYAIVFACLAAPAAWRNEGRRGLFRLVASRSWRLALAFLLSGSTLLPGIHRIHQSVRTQATVESNLSESLEYSQLPFVLLGGTGGPIYPEYIDKSCFVGAVAIGSILLLALRRRSWRDRRFLCGLSLVVAGLVFALGRNIGIQYIMPWVPGFRDLAGAPRALVLTAVGVAVLTALALDQLEALIGSPRRRWLTAAGCLVLGAACLGDVALRTAATPIHVAGRVWIYLVAPGVPQRQAFVLLDSGLTLLAAGAIVWLAGGRDRTRLALLAGLIFAQLWHFTPRVNPTIERRESFEAPPPVVWLQKKQAQSAGAPFRIAGYDPLRLHDTEFDNRYKIHFLMPNLATLYRLEDIEGFDPLIELRYADLVEQTAGRASFNDPIRNLDIESPDAQLFKVLGVRFLIGHPYDRRLTAIPQFARPDTRELPVTAWDESGTTQPITQWSFVSTLNGAVGLPLGTEVARLHVEAAEGAFDFPVRNGVETADLLALNGPALTASPEFRAWVNMEWSAHEPVADYNYRQRRSNYRGRIAFDRPLRVKSLVWKISQLGLTFVVSSQAYRLARPLEAEDPWRLVFGEENDPAPVFEFLLATPRAVVSRLSTPRGDSENALNVPWPVFNDLRAAGTVEWLARSSRSLSLRTTTDEAAQLLLREIWDPNWSATVNAQPVAVRSVNGLLRAVNVPAGTSEIRFAYRPGFIFGFFWLLGVVLVAAQAWRDRRAAARVA